MKNNNKNKGSILVIVSIIVIAAILSGGLYYYFQTERGGASLLADNSSPYPKKISEYTLTNTSTYEDCDGVAREEAQQVGLRVDFRVCVLRTTLEYSKENGEKIIVTHDVVTNGNDLVKKYSQTYFSKYADAQGVIKPSATELMWLVKDSADRVMVKEYGLGNNGLHYRAPSLDNAVVARYRKNFPRE